MTTSDQNATRYYPPRAPRRLHTTAAPRARAMQAGKAAESSIAEADGENRDGDKMHRPSVLALGSDGPIRRPDVHATESGVSNWTRLRAPADGLDGESSTDDGTTNTAHKSPHTQRRKSRLVLTAMSTAAWTGDRQIDK